MSSQIPKRCANASSEQKELIAEFVQRHPKLISGKFSNSFSFKDGQKLWQEAADILNAVPNGGHKTWIQWRKTWQDLQSRTKKKGAQIKKLRLKTGGGSKDEVPSFKPEEEAVLDIISKVSTEGHDVEETHISFSFEEIGLPEEQHKENEMLILNKSGTNENLPEQSTGNNEGITRKRKSSARILKETASHANYLGSIQRDYFNEKKEFNRKVLSLKMRKVEALEKYAAAQERTATALEAVAAALLQISNNLN